MKNILALLLILGSSLNLYSQGHNIDGTITGLTNSNIYLMSVIGQQQKIVDTAFTDMNGSFRFELDGDFPTGMYLLAAGAKQMIEIIYNNEDIRFVTSGSSEQDNVQITESIENLIWYDYLYLKGYNQYKMEVIESVLMNYPPEDEYYTLSEIKYNQLQNVIISRSDELANDNPLTMASKFIKVDRPNFAPSNLEDAEKQQFLINHHFDHTDFSDTLLLRSNILTSKIVKYLTIYQKPNLSQMELEDNLITAVDSILAKALVEQKVYEFVVDFLVKGFETIGFERGLEHIAEQNQLAELCVNSERKSELENRMELIKKLAIGKVAPDFEATDINGKTVKLSDISSKKTILVFWASWCPHCTDMMPVLKEYYNANSREELEIIAISVDSQEEEYQEAVKTHTGDWINIAELKGWNGAIVEEYGIHATPTVFILDQEKTILAKPTNNSKLKMDMEKLKN